MSLMMQPSQRQPFTMSCDKIVAFRSNASSCLTLCVENEIPIQNNASWLYPPTVYVYTRRIQFTNLKGTRCILSGIKILNDPVLKFCCYEMLLDALYYFHMMNLKYVKVVEIKTIVLLLAHWFFTLIDYFSSYVDMG